MNVGKKSSAPPVLGDGRRTVWQNELFLYTRNAIIESITLFK